MKNSHKVFLKKQIIFICFCVIVFNLSTTCDSFGKLNDKYKDGAMCIGGVSGVALAAAAIPEPIVTKGVAAVCGAFQVGYFATGFIWNLFDPPDTINHCVPVNLSTFLSYHYPDVLTVAPQTDPILAQHLNVCADYADTLVALSRAILTANDRYQGALLKKNLACALARRNELNTFIDMFNRLRPFLRLCWVPVFQRIHILYPPFFNIVVPKSLMRQMRDDVGAGNFPPIEQTAINAWQLSQSEMSILSNFVGRVPDSMIDVFYDNYSIGSNDIPVQACLEQSLDCATDFDIQPVTSSAIYNFTTQSSGTAIELYSVSAVSESVCWVAGQNGIIRRTTNGGSNWTPILAPLAGVTIYSINALDSTKAFCSLTPSLTQIYKTTNAGTNWSQVFSQSGGFINDIQMISSTEGYAMGDPVGGKWTILKTTNSGNTWTRMVTEPNQVGSEAGWSNSFQIIGTHMFFGTSSSRLYHSTDLGLTWTSPPTASTVSTYALHFNSEKNGLAGGTGMVSSNDTGETYSQVSAPLTQVYGLDGSGMNWFAIGNGASIYKSADNGLNWTSVSTHTGSVFYAIDLVENGAMAQASHSLTGWIVGSGGKIVKMSTTTLEATLNLKVIIEGFYNSGSNSQVSDTINSYLRNNTSPYALVDSARGIMNSSGNAVLEFSNAAAGNYYLVNKHRNSIETWSSSGIAMAPSTVTNYNFTSASTQAFGNNLVQVDFSPATFANYSGDANQDGTVDAADLVLVYNDGLNFVTGYLPTDLNGDQFTDVSDLIIGYNNAINFVSVIRP